MVGIAEKSISSRFIPARDHGGAPSPAIAPARKVRAWRMPASQLTTTESYDRASVTAIGSLDHTMTDRLDARLCALVDAGILFVLVDLSAVAQYHPTLDTALARVQEQLRCHGGLLVTAGADQRLDAELATATLVEVFALYRSAPDPAESASASAPITPPLDTDHVHKPAPARGSPYTSGVAGSPDTAR